MKCNNCGLEFNQSDLSQVFAHEHQNEYTIETSIPGKEITHKVVSIFNKTTELFSGEEWECNAFIEEKFGNGFMAIMHTVISI